METERKSRRCGEGEPPNDGREWCSIDAVAARLGVTRRRALRLTHLAQWRTFRQRPYRTWVLKRDVDFHLEIEAMRKRALRRRKPKTWREQICRDVDEATVKRIFWTAAQAALYMGVQPATIRKWGYKGKIPVFLLDKKGKPTNETQRWYSPSSLRHLKDDVEHCKQRAEYEKSRETRKSGAVGQLIYMRRHKPCAYRKPIPAGWLSTREVAERLKISRCSVRALQRSGRILGKQLYKGRLEDLGDWEEAANHHWFFPEYAIEELLKDEEYLRLREKGKAANSPTRRERKPTSSV